MFSRLNPKEWLPALMRLPRSLAGDRRGVAAIEFAFIAPVLLSLYFVTMEVAQGIEANKKVGRIGSMVADLVTQQLNVDTDALDAIMEIGGAILQPYNRTKPTITITAIKITGNAGALKGVVQWSREMKGDTFGAGPEIAPAETPVPEKLLIPNTFLVRVSAELDYRPVIAWTAQQKASLGLAAAFDNIRMSETYYLRPRMSAEIGCDDC
jgi:Flp pilus assembly protein TadG